MSDHIILISCSNGKVRGGNSPYNTNDSVAALLPPDIRQELWHRRYGIASQIIAGKVEDRLRGDGNRRDSRYNIALQMGADLSCTSICGHKAGKESLGGFVYHLCEGSLRNSWPNKEKRSAVCRELAHLLTIRNRMSHRGVVTRAELLTARNAIFKRDSLMAALVHLKMAVNRT